MNERLSLFEALSAAATRRPWEQHETSVYFPLNIGGFSLRHTPNAEANAAFIASIHDILTLAVEQHWKLAELESAIQLERELAAAANKDAERYRWLRNYADNKSHQPFIAKRAQGYDIVSQFTDIYADSLVDEAIDAALKESP